MPFLFIGDNLGRLAMKRKVIVALLTLNGLFIIMIFLFLLLLASLDSQEVGNDTNGPAESREFVQKDISGRILDGSTSADANSMDELEVVEPDTGNHFFQETFDIICFYLIFKISIISIMIFGRRFM